MTVVIKKIMLAGGSGFIGSYLFKFLKDKRFNVVNFDIKNDKKQDALILDNLLNFLKQNADIDVIINLIRFQDPNGKGGRDTGYDYPHLTIKENCITQLNICEAARLFGITKKIYFSSCAVHGVNSMELEEGTPFSPSDPYGVSKVASENILRIYDTYDKYNRSVIIRPTLVVGENQMQWNILQDFVVAASNQRPLPIFQSKNFPNGSHEREFVHVQDICRAIKEIIDHYFYEMDNQNEAFILGSKANRITIDDLAGMVIERFKGGKKQYCKARTRYELYSQVTNSNKAKKELSWESSISIGEIIDKIALNREK